MNWIQGAAIGACVISMLAGTSMGQCSQSGETKTESKVVNANYRTHADSKDIVDTAVEAGSFKTLAAALKASGLIDKLEGKGPFTKAAIFAITIEKAGGVWVSDMTRRAVLAQLPPAPGT